MLGNSSCAIVALAVAGISSVFDKENTKDRGGMSAVSPTDIVFSCIECVVVRVVKEGTVVVVEKNNETVFVVDNNSVVVVVVEKVGNVVVVGA